MPKIHTTFAISVTNSTKFTWYPTVGETVTDIIGLTVEFKKSNPLCIMGVFEVVKSEGMVSALGIKLNTLSIDIGKTSRNATIPHITHLRYLGIFLNTNRIKITASAIYVAVILMLKTFKNSSTT
jgi:hypothetical protein